MKKTKERILDIALELFNTEGLSKVTLRTIAKKMGISQGNLNYHYKKRDEIIEALYYELVQEIENTIAPMTSKETNLSLMIEISTIVIKDYYKYRFIFLDFVQIMRAYPNLKKHYLKASKYREKQFLTFIELFVNNDIIRPEKLPNEYLMFYYRIQALGNFWISSAETSYNKITKTTISQYTEAMKQAFFPYLTKKGEIEYFSL